MSWFKVGEGDAVELGAADCKERVFSGFDRVWFGTETEEKVSVRAITLRRNCCIPGCPVFLDDCTLAESGWKKFLMSLPFFDMAAAFADKNTESWVRRADDGE